MDLIASFLISSIIVPIIGYYLMHLGIQNGAKNNLTAVRVFPLGDRRHPARQHGRV